MPMGACLPAEYTKGPVPALWSEPPELPSGAGPFDVATTTSQLSDATAFPPYTSELEPEDITHLHQLDAGDGEWLRGETALVLLPQQHGMSSWWICSLWACHLPGGIKATLLGRGGLPLLPASCAMTCHDRHLS